MGIFSWIASLGRQPLPRVGAEYESPRDEGGTTAAAGEAQIGPVKFAATLTTFSADQWEGSRERARVSEDVAHSSGWERQSVHARPTLHIHYRQRYRGRDTFRTVVYEIELAYVDRAAFGAYRLVGSAKSGGKSYSEKAFPSNRIELVADTNGEVIEDFDEWLDIACQPTPGELAFDAAKGRFLVFEPKLEAVIEWKGMANDHPDRYRVEVSKANWPYFERGPRLETYARRMPRDAGQRAWAGRKVFYSDEILRISERGDDEAIEDVWGWLVDRAR